MASSSSSHQYNVEHIGFSGIEPDTKRRKVSESSRLFDVFINHRGPDAKETLAVPLYNSLQQLGLRAFLDREEMEVGEYFPSTIETAIRSASAQIAIFSGRYAESAWCLAELDLMLQSGAKIFPIFYGVKPSELRYIESGAYADAFRKYKEKGKYLLKLETWEKALQSASLITGLEINSADPFRDSKAFKNLVLDLQKEVERTKPLFVAQHPVALHVKDFESQCLDKLVHDFENQCGLNIEGNDHTKIVGIFGMGGAGKTTLAKELFNRKRSNYMATCFLFDVREKSSRFGLPSLRAELIRELFPGSPTEFRSREEGINYVRDRLGSSRFLSFLIVVDDIDHVKQLDTLCLMDMANNFHNILVIVTTRDVGVLTSAGIINRYNLEGLNRDDGRELFCWHSFGRPNPASGYENLVDAFVGVCGGLPLSLQVLGRHVHNRPVYYWELQLCRVRESLHPDIKDILKISFDALNRVEKQIFMDIACFFVDRCKNTAIRVWEGCGWGACYALETLKDRCLIEEGEGLDGLMWEDKPEVFKMHDHLRDLGRAMSDDLSSPPRHWSPKHHKSLESKGFQNILTQTTGRCFHSFMDQSMDCQVTYFIGEPEDSPDVSLLWLQLDYQNHSQLDMNSDINPSIPAWISLQNLQCLRISRGRFQRLWQSDSQAPTGLKELQVRETFVKEFPDSLSQLIHVAELNLSGCEMLSSLPDGFGNLVSLRILNLEEGSDAPLQLRECVIFDCPKFQRFPNSIGLLRHLKRIVLTNGKNVSSLPEEFCQLQSLEHLQLCACVMLSSLPVRFGDLRTLRHLDLSSCKMLRRLPVSFQYLILLEYLNLQECGQLTLMPEDFQNITKLKFLNLSWCQQLEELPSPITNQASLRELYLNNVKRLKELPINIGQLSSLRKMSIGSDLMTRLPNSLGDLSSLTHLSILSCHNLKCLPDSLGYLSSLTILSIENCPELESLPNSLGELSSLTLLSIENCPKLKSLPNSLGDLFSLTNLSILDCHNLKCLPDSLGYLSSLTILSIESCPELESLPNSLGNLSSLTDLSIQFCHNLKHLPDSLGHLCSLTNIKISNCPMLPDSFEQLTNLEKLNLSDCIVLPSLPAESDNLTRGQNIDLKSDIQLSILPADSKQSLQASYYELDKEEREMFLDAACFLIGEKKSKAVALWDGSGWSGMRGLQTIENKCLVELVDDPDYDGEKIMKMHDHIRDMGRQIASRQSPYRIWSPEQIIHMKKHSMERKLIRGIQAAGAFVELKEHMHQPIGESSGRYQNLRFPTGLKILSVQENEFTEELASLSQDLVWLRWEGFPLRNLPSWLQLQNLSVLELHGANEMEELWQDQEHAPLQLRELIITGTWSASFERFPSSISYLIHLRKIALLGDVGKEFGIKGLPEEFCCLQSLEHLQLRHCIFLSSLPTRFGDLGSLRHLDLCSCKELRILPDSFKQLTQLQYLNFSDCDKLTLQRDILENIRNLKNLYLSACLKLRQLPDQITDQASLRELRLQDTRLDVLPPNIGQLRKLELLTIGSPFLTSLPDSLGDLSSLKILSISDCIDLKSLPETLGGLTHLEHLCIESSEVMSLPEGLKGLANLQSLKISGCPLSTLDFGSGSSALCNLRVIEISETCVTRISIAEDCCPRLETLHISRNDDLEEIGTLPTTVKNVELSECQKLNYNRLL